LLVEDEAAVRDGERDFLVRQGYRVLTAQNGQEAIRVSREHQGPIHLVITDVVMPEMGGAELAQQLSWERTGVKVLFMSGYAESAVLAHGEIDIKRCFLQKPFSLRALARKIREVIETDRPAASAAASN